MSYPSQFADIGTFRLRLSLPCVLVLGIVAGCNNSCFVGVINPPNNSFMVSVSNPPPPCSLAQPKLAIKIVAHLVPTCSFCSSSRQVTHVHLLLSGMELHPSAVADEDSSDWRELVPDWARQPQWVDLGEDLGSGEVALPLKETDQISVGTFYHLRLRLAHLSFQHSEQLRSASPCSSLDSSCVVTADGSLYQLQTLVGHPYLRVETSSPIDLRTSQLNRLRIELRPEWALQIPSSGVLDLVPLMRGQVFIESSSPVSSF
jgi:hypothetical protein